MAPLRLYIDLMSQPCRSVVVLCRLNKLPVEEVAAPIGKGVPRSREFKEQVNPLGKVPALVEGSSGGLRLGESASIMRYLCETQAIAGASWYPSCPKARARVNSICDWHLSNLRIGSMITVFNRAVSISLGFQGNEQLVQIYGLPTLKAALRTIESVWLAEGAFLGGLMAPSIADLLLSCEVEQLCLLDGAAEGPDMAELLEPHPRLRAWLARVAAACGPHYEQAHTMLRKVRGRLVQLKVQRASRL